MLLALNQNSSPREVKAKYLRTRRRLLVLEYDGAVVPYELHPGLTVPSEELKSTLRKLSKDPKNTIMLITGRDMDHLDKYWMGLQIILVAENGAYYRVPGGSWQSLFSSSSDWINRVANAMRSLAFQFSGSFIEEKNHSLVWHHRASREPVYESELRQILAAVNALNHSDQFTVRYNEFALELSTAGIDPGTFLARWIGGQSFDFILAMGTLRLEDSVFPLLTSDACTVRVGPMTTSRANFHLGDQGSVVQFLNELSSGSEESLSLNIARNGFFGWPQSKPDDEPQ